MEIVRAALQHLDIVAPLFDQYRQFYQQPADAAGSRAFIEARLRNQDGVIFVALESGKGLGFVQLYHSLESVTMRHLWILYDLFTVKDARKKGVGRALMERARQLAIETGADRLILETANDNLTAQRLYESLGYKRDEVFYRYYLRV
jgi:GNAT superfamily N-acetyltransferase